MDCLQLGWKADEFRRQRQFLNSTARLMIITSHTITNLVFDELMFLISTTATTTETNIVPSTKVNRHIHGCLQKSARGKSYASR
ncbi:hypothetical protein C4D60_Mb11t16310 [Musa balbisiana]|uniref:Uncharacterized protein n=1 Tax=Musa balbisiana TaxID=52838 RepID=A0A4S8J4H9_MUSBA|nr:hypothetical protein C4D60_Mb11t16310 [Musa balbisiana]